MKATNFLPRGRRAVDALSIGVAGFFCLGTIFVQLSREPVDTHGPVRESFNPSLESIGSVDAAVGYILGERGARDPQGRADEADELVRERFYHGYSFYGPKQNWLAYLAGFVWIDLRSPVLPDDILKHPQAACSQQVIVFEALARRLGLDAASVRMDHHMAAAVKIDGQWQVYDADREISPRSYPLSRLVAGDPRVLAIYGKIGRAIDLQAQASNGEIRLTDVNRNPALHASLFQRVTQFLSAYGWALFSALAGLRLWRSRKSVRSTAQHAALAA